MHYAVSSREADINVNASSGDYDGVRVDMDDNTGTGTAFISGEFTPAQARELAAALLRAADEAEGVEHVDAEQAVRNKVADELEQMDGTNMGMNISRTQATNVARRGLRPMDTRHGTTQRMRLY